MFGTLGFKYILHPLCNPLAQTHITVMRVDGVLVMLGIVLAISG